MAAGLLVGSYVPWEQLDIDSVVGSHNDRNVIPPPPTSMSRWIMEATSTV